ncbi:MAG: hypothetical protein ACLGJA_16980 [Gammaproteobacteria bacterium]
MRKALPLALAALLLGGCASHKPEDYNGTWINQAAIDAATDAGSLRYTLGSHGAPFEWNIDVARKQASFTNGFEAHDGEIVAVTDQMQVTFPGNHIDRFVLSGDQLQVTDSHGMKQHFVKPEHPAPAGARIGSSFEKALYKAFMGGEWKILEGPGKGSVVRFADDGGVTGLPGPDRYALCMSGDCTSMGGENDTLWLERNQRGGPFIFKRAGDKMEIFQVINNALPEDIPQLSPGKRQWVLERS